MGISMVTLLERIEKQLPIARDLCERKGVIDTKRYAWFDPLTLADLEEIRAALVKA
jgi:uncharacterized membrane-anchored protein